MQLPIRVGAVHSDCIPHEVHRLITRQALRLQFGGDLRDGDHERARLAEKAQSKRAAAKKTVSVAPFVRDRDHLMALGTRGAIYSTDASGNAATGSSSKNTEMTTPPRRFRKLPTAGPPHAPTRRTDRPPVTSKILFYYPCNDRFDGLFI